MSRHPPMVDAVPAMFIGSALLVMDEQSVTMLQRMPQVPVLRFTPRKIVRLASRRSPCDTPAKQD
ncbi:hypothetical protein [Bradyrhizobium sp. RDM4]|uniref:hypothetical protein n=1 Tax=Bradyrhizobium sp. RDM4 TaxID=3378765 RepID=UPI0038FCE6A4